MGSIKVDQRLRVTAVLNRMKIWKNAWGDQSHFSLRFQLLNPMKLFNSTLQPENAKCRSVCVCDFWVTVYLGSFSTFFFYFFLGFSLRQLPPVVLFISVVLFFILWTHKSCLFVSRFLVLKLSFKPHHLPAQHAASVQFFTHLSLRPFFTYLPLRLHLSLCFHEPILFLTRGGESRKCFKLIPVVWNTCINTCVLSLTVGAAQKLGFEHIKVERNDKNEPSAGRILHRITQYLWVAKLGVITFLFHSLRELSEYKTWKSWPKNWLSWWKCTCSKTFDTF